MANKNEIKFEQPSELLIIFNRYIIVIMSLLIFVVLILGYLFLLKPKIASNEARQEINNKNIINQEASKRLLDNLAKLEVEYKNIQSTRQEDLEQLKRILPTNPQIAELFVLAEKLAIDNGLKLNSVDTAQVSVGKPKQNNAPTDEDALPSEVAATDQAESLGNKSVTLKTLSLHFSLVRISDKELKEIFLDQRLPFDSSMDDYTLFKNYIATLEANLRLMDIQTLSLPALSTEISRSMPNFSFSVLTYYR